ncbi:MAG: histidinol dehydrogenase [Ignavibacteriae bacterium]|nr:histidinol dehydrogenase [Ignavibacteriota bacterium]
MTIYRLSELSEKKYVSLLARGGVSNDSTSSSVREICLAVKQRGDAALRDYTKLFDGVDVKQFRIPETDIQAAMAALRPDLISALKHATENIRAFHKAQLTTEKPVETMPGVTCWREPRAIECVGLYIPAGSAPLPSTVLMLGIPAMLAGCERVILCSPPQKSGQADPLVLAAAQLVGINEIYCVGGAQAIAAMAYGTESIPKVHKIFGPGNAFVTATKQFVSCQPGGAAIDGPAGPSELLIIADKTANASYVAADLLSQAEHGADSQVVLVSTDAEFAQRVNGVVQGLLESLPRKKILKQSLANSFIVVANSLDDAIHFSNDYAPEHLIINVQSPEKIVPLIRNAGSVFLGQYAPVTAGDYASGTNHTLPTGGAAAAYSGVAVESFQKFVSFQTISEEGLRNLAPTLTTLAEAEGFEAHKRAVTVRFTS